MGDKKTLFLCSHRECHRLLACELSRSALLCVEVVEPGLATKDLTGFGKFETLGE